MDLSRCGGRRNRGVVRLVNNKKLQRIWSDEKSKRICLTVQDVGSSRDQFTSYVYTLGLKVEDLMALVQELAENFPDDRDSRRNVRKHLEALGLLVFRSTEKRD